MLLHFLALGNKQGDVYYVVSESAEYVWINDNGTLRWELLGMTVDTSNFLTKTGLFQTTGNSTNNTMSQNAITQELAYKQPNLVSGTNIKTINNQSILGSGNIEISPSYINYNEKTKIGIYNNKNLYQQTFSFTSPSQTQYSTVIYTIPIPSNSNIIDWDCTLIASNNNKIKLNYYNSSSDFAYIFITPDNEVKMNIGHSAYASRPCEITIKWIEN